MSAWMPIETAPKDGTTILLCCVGKIPQTGVFDDALGWIDFDSDDDSRREEWIETRSQWSPTHWQPLPPPPESTP